MRKNSLLYISKLAGILQVMLLYLNLMKKSHYFFSERYLLPFLSGYIVEIIFSKIMRTVAKVATAGLDDMIWNLSKNLNFF